MLAGFTVPMRLGRGPRFDVLHLIPDPWNNAGRADQARYRMTTRLILAEFGQPSSILEIGAGEGYHTEHLTEMCDRVVGVELDERARRRAIAAVRDATFVSGTANDLSRVPTGTFDVVIAAEVLFYAANVRSALALMTERAARGCVVTTVDFESSKVMPHVLDLPGVEHQSFNAHGLTWDVAWWRTVTEPSAANAASSATASR
jgi:2-polyprenyl-3-methyl-5-hydroxy-6-metoxy-1,4-benzoquinol methylase